MLESLPWLLRAVTAHNRLICRDIRELSPILFFCTFPLFLWFFNKLLADYEQSCKCDGEEYDSASVTQGKVSLRITKNVIQKSLKIERYSKLHVSEKKNNPRAASYAS